MHPEAVRTCRSKKQLRRAILARSHQLNVNMPPLLLEQVKDIDTLKGFLLRSEMNEPDLVKQRKFVLAWVRAHLHHEPTEITSSKGLWWTHQP